MSLLGMQQDFASIFNFNQVECSKCGSYIEILSMIGQLANGPDKPALILPQRLQRDNERAQPNPLGPHLCPACRKPLEFLHKFEEGLAATMQEQMELLGLEFPLFIVHLGPRVFKDLGRPEILLGCVVREAPSAEPFAGWLELTHDQYADDMDARTFDEDC